MSTKKPKPAKKPSAKPLSLVTTTGPKTCKPFVIEVMVFAPASGFKIEVNIEKSCSPQADPIWKIVFDLYKRNKKGDGFDQLVHVSFKGGTPIIQQGIQATAANGINPKQSDVIVNEAGPAVLDLKDSENMTPAQLAAKKKEVSTAATRVANFALEE